MNNKRTRYLIAAALILALAGCGGPEPDQTSSPSRPDQLAHLFLENAPSIPTPVAQIVSDPVEGAEVSITGRIGGTLHPFGEGFAVFFLADDSLVFCNERPGDPCETPWDACCEDPEKITAGRLLVQFHDESGEVLPQSLEGVNGLSNLDMVTVTGTVVGGQEGVVTIHADALFIHEDETI